MRVAIGDNLAFLVAIGTTTDDGNGFVATSVEYQNLTDQSVVVVCRRLNGVSIFTQTITPNTTLTSVSINGSVANRTIVNISMSWGI